MRKFVLPSVLALSLLTFAASVYAGGAYCSSKAGAKGAAACLGKTAALPEGMKIETMRLPSGALAIFYTSDKPEVVKVLRERATSGPDNFSCGICREMAQAKDCKVELVSFSGGVLAFVTADAPAKLDAFEKQFAALTTAQTTTP